MFIIFAKSCIIVLDKFLSTSLNWRPDFVVYILINLANIYLFKVNNRNTRKRCEICSKLTIKTYFPSFSSVSIVDFEQVNVGWESIVLELYVLTFFLKKWYAFNFLIVIKGFLLFSQKYWDKLFKNRPSKICGRQPLKLGGWNHKINFAKKL